MFKIFGAFILCLAIVSCKTCKNSNTPPIEAAPAVDYSDSTIVGKVFVGETCPLYIEAYEGENKVILYPVNLDEGLQFTGAFIRFQYTLSRAKQPSTCAVDKVVSLENVEQLR
jgi:hypothetical protein